MSESKFTIIEADLSRADHQQDILRLLNGYSMDAMGDGRPLGAMARRDVIAGLRQHPTTLVFLVCAGSTAVGLAICFRGFSTFAARPLVNIHDFFIEPEYRGRGLGRQLLGAIEQFARAAGCVRLTLEVQENNQRAKSIYAAAGFAPMLYVAEAGSSLNFSKSLS